MDEQTTSPETPVEQAPQEVAQTEGKPTTEQISDTPQPWYIPTEGVVKVKGAGKEHEFRSFDELTKAATMGIGARKAFTELDELRKEREARDAQWKTAAEQIQAFEERLKADPYSVLRDYGHDPLTLSERQLKQHIDLQAMTPEQRAEKARQEQADRELIELRQYKQERETEKQKSEREAQEEAKAEELHAAQVELESAIVKEIETDPVLGVETVRPRMVQRVAQIMAESNAAGIYCPPDKAVAYLRAERQAEIRDHVKGMSAEQAIAFLGEDWARGIREYDVKRAKEPGKQAPAKASGERKQYSTMAEFLASEKGLKV